MFMVLFRPHQGMGRARKPGGGLGGSLSVGEPQAGSGWLLKPSLALPMACGLGLHRPEFRQLQAQPGEGLAAVQRVGGLQAFRLA
jgi:hypothetical protein